MHWLPGSFRARRVDHDFYGAGAYDGIMRLLGATFPPLTSLLRLLCCAVLLLPPLTQAGSVVTVELRGAISPASAAYFERALARAHDEQAELLVATLDTPGGLDTAMREMIQAILGSRVPVAMFVSPGGARAASAGTYLLYASHVAAMTPGTNLGAATPVEIGIGGTSRPAEPRPDENTDAKRDKAVHDAAAYLRSLAQLRGRNADWADQAVLAAASLSAEEALKRGVIDLVAADLPDLLRRLDGRRVTVTKDETRVLALAGATVNAVERDWQERLLAALADPNIALILLMLGVYGLLFEFYTPGMGAPGVIGGICLLLALYGLALLPINYVGVALILLGVALMVAEAFVPSFGVLGIGGLTAFVAGALMLVDADMPGLTLSWRFLMPFVLVSAAVFGSLGWLALRARHRPPVSGAQAMIGTKVEALEDIPAGGTGWVRASGERWHAHCAERLAKGATARITAIDGLTLQVRSLGGAADEDVARETKGERP